MLLNLNLPRIYRHRNGVNTMKKTLFELRLKVQAKHLILMLSIITFLAMTIFISENAEYISITSERLSIAATVASGNCEFDDLEEDYNICQDRLGHLGETSGYGKMLVRMDASGWGKLGIFLLLVGQFAVIVFSATIMWVALCAFLEKIMRKLYQLMAAKAVKQNTRRK